MKIYLSPLAELKLVKLLGYLEEEWGKSSRDTFLEKLQDKLEQVKEHPMSNTLTEGFDDVHWCVVTPQTSFFYRVVHNNNEIEVITVTDNRQEPEKIIKEIRNHFNT